MQMMTVSSLNTKIKSLLEATFMHIMVEGEIAQVTYASSGHLYFTIKDDQSTLKCVMWRSSVAKLKFALAKGEHIVIEGSVGVYTPRGEYQFIATHIEPYGKGALAVAYEQLKSRLKAKGYFDAHIKKSLIRYPAKIAIVTAAGSAALQDMLKVAQKRWPALEITVVDVLVQGAQAAGEIARGITYADTLGADIIIVGRGGGSSEDLWAFNEECVADAIYHVKTAIVSAVGHEVDTLISDFVADMRAPTPSAAMEMILPDRDELRMMLDERAGQLIRRISQLLSTREERVSMLAAALSRSSLPHKLLLMQKQFSSLEYELESALTYRLIQSAQKAEPLLSKFQQAMQFILQSKKGAIKGTVSRLASLNPKHQVKEAWVQLNRHGRKVRLEEIEIGEEFDLVSESMKMRVKSIEKEIL